MKGRLILQGLLITILGPAVGIGTAAERAYRLPSVDLKQQVIWGSSCDSPDGAGLAFGGQHQRSDDGLSHTRIKQDGQWQAIHEQLRAHNPWQALCDRTRAVSARQKKAAAGSRSIYFQGLPPDEQSRLVERELAPLQREIVREVTELSAALKQAAEPLKGYDAGQARCAGCHLGSAQKEVTSLAKSLAEGVTAESVQRMFPVVVSLEKAAEALDAEPPPRALSPIVYDVRTKLYVLFGGDHCDYLTNDTWVFDPAKQRWVQRHPNTAPPPRANHTLTANGNGKITLTGGYTYTSNTDYCGGQYRDIGDGPWTYDIAANQWTGPDAGISSGTRVYRTGPFHPDFYLQAPKPDAAAVKRQLDALPANTWVAMDPPRLPKLNRDWGSAVLDADHDLILRFSGGHSAHGGTDVLHYHLSTNRWELCFPVEFPLGQLYSNTSYPEGFNLNRRPWVTGHTYQSYGYDPALKMMLFAGQTSHYYLYDPVVGDWIGRGPKPKGMAYNDCFYDVTMCSTPRETFAWTKNGEVFRFDAERRQWDAWELGGVALPGAVVDNSTLVYDAKRDRLLLARKLYGEQNRYDGQLYALDLKTREVSALSPEGSKAAAAIPYLCQIRYDLAHDLLLVGGTLAPGADGLRRTPAYDCAANRWISLRITGQDPSGKQGRNVSLGLMYDAKRKLFWAVDTNSQVYVLRLDLKTADPQPL